MSKFSVVALVAMFSVGCAVEMGPIDREPTREGAITYEADVPETQRELIRDAFTEWQFAAPKAAPESVRVELGFGREGAMSYEAGVILVNPDRSGDYRDALHVMGHAFGAPDTDNVGAMSAPNNMDCISVFDCASIETNVIYCENTCQDKF